MNQNLEVHEIEIKHRLSDAAGFIFGMEEKKEDEYAKLFGKRSEEYKEQVEKVHETIRVFDLMHIDKLLYMRMDKIQQLIREDKTVATFLLHGLDGMLKHRNYFHLDRTIKRAREIVRNCISEAINSSEQQPKESIDDIGGQQVEKPERIRWLTKKEQLELLGKKLKEHGLVVNPDSFTGQFHCEGIQAAEKKCQWLYSDRLLGYLLDKLCNKNLIPQEFNRTQAAKALFLKKSGEAFTESFTKNMSNQRGLSKSSPKGSDMIDTIIADSLDTK